MTCGHARGRSTRIPALGGDDLVHTETLCTLKMRSKSDQLRVYEALFKLGLEHSMLTNVCPVASTGRWAACPFRTP
jgi:hypothetical protein